ncbi:MAG: KH domain-containing protein [Chloroflexi bacterium]|nr:KH domain-containing protein [Chloroflexota bacterium]
MNNRMTIEVIAPTVEEAIEKGLDELGLEPDDVEVEVMDEGKRNLFRFAARQARVKLTVKSSEKVNPLSESDEVVEVIDEEDETLDFNLPLETEEDEELGDSNRELDYYKVKTRVHEIVKKLLELMKTYAIATVEVKESEDDDRQFVSVEIEGDDLSFLIGRHAETLNAIQYMISLMISHEFNRWIPIQVDIQNYRSRREKELQKLARRMADQVVSTGRKQTLEPMPANERRIIHIELRKRDDVFTESVGEDPYRKVYIHPAD